MKAIILAAGRGSRMGGLTEELPKCLVQLHGKTLLEWQIAALRRGGVEEIAIVTGYRRKQLAKYGLVEVYNERWAETNMVSSLDCADEWLKSQACVVSYSDLYYEYTAVTSLFNSQASLALTYDPEWLDLWEQRFEDPLEDAETFRVNSDGTLAEIGGVPSSVEEVKGQYMGLLRFTPIGWEEVQRIRQQLLSEQCDQMHMTETLQRVIDAGKIEIEALSYRGQWMEVDSEKDLIHGNSVLL